MAILSAYREAWASRGKSLVMSSTNRMKRTGPSTEPWGTPRLMRKEQLQEPPTWTLALRSERKERIQRTKQGGEFEQEEFMKPSRVPDRIESLGEVNRCQNDSIWRLFLLEVVPDWLRQSKNLVKRRPTKAKAGLASGEEMIRFEVKSWARKNQALKKLWDARGERNWAEGGRRESGFSRFVNGDDGGRFPTRGESTQGPGPAEKKKKEE